VAALEDASVLGSWEQEEEDDDGAGKDKVIIGILGRRRRTRMLTCGKTGNVLEGDEGCCRKLKVSWQLKDGSDAP
jgi:hypothetical protein